jgi:hypothetical protein
LTSNAALLNYSAIAVGVGSAIGYSVGLPQSAVSAIFPFAVRGSVSAAAAAGASAGATIVGILVATLSTLIIASTSLAAEAAIPGNLQTLIDSSANYNVEWVMQNCGGVVSCGTASISDLRAAMDQGLFAALLRTTSPDYPGTEPAPAPQPEDPRLIVLRAGDSAASPVDWLRYKSDDTNGSARAVRLSSGPWFVDKPDGAGDAEARLALSISFKDASGGTWTARRAGNQFLLVRTGIRPGNIDYPPPRLTASLSVVDPSGIPVTVQVGE